MNLHEYDRKTMNITAHYHYGNKDFSVSQIIIKSYYLGITIWSDWLNQFLWKVDIYSETWLYYLYFGMVLGKEQNVFHIIYIKKKITQTRPWTMFLNFLFSANNYAHQSNQISSKSKSYHDPALNLKNSSPALGRLIVHVLLIFIAHMILSLYNIT